MGWTEGNVPECDDITPEQVIARQRNDGSAWLVDQWGRAHPVKTGAAIGRDIDECALGVLHASVSAVHARLRQFPNGSWEIADQGSLNGTRVNHREARRVALTEGDVIQIGDVGFRFTCRETREAEPLQGSGQTKRSNVQELPVQLVLRSSDREVILIRRAEGGAVKAGDEQVRLAALEYALLRTLVERQLAGDEGDGGFISSRELAATLEFRTRLADTDNVRELVRRVRQKLNALDASDLIGNQRGSGYRLGWSVASDG